MENLIEPEKEKWYNKNNLRLLIFVTLIIIILMNAIFLGTTLYARNYNERLAQTDFYVDVNELGIVCSYESEEQIVFFMNSEYYNVMSYQYEAEEKNETKVVYLDVVGKYTSEEPCRRCYTSVDLDENIHKIYVKDKIGNTKEIWNKTQGALVEKL